MVLCLPHYVAPTGSLTLASPAVKFIMDSEATAPSDVELYQLKESHALVEEFMLLANVSVAEYTLKYFAQFALLRYERCRLNLCLCSLCLGLFPSIPSFFHTYNSFSLIDLRHWSFCLPCLPQPTPDACAQFFRALAQCHGRGWDTNRLVDVQNFG